MTQQHPQQQRCGEDDIPDFILAKPRFNDVPEIIASCDKQDIDDLKDCKQKGEYIYRRIGRR